MLDTWADVLQLAGKLCNDVAHSSLCMNKWLGYLMQA